ncbi:hypothetical protein BdWA1_002459 [Babesia duncani]|uniref:Uncharacterized protein n=1 Tax=Babesia duncani TaxID=323732 RepID=A0AAD9PJQ9_9APIC|nr:hypothetical protein BdWA1_002459 [Babesia duncani]
MYKLSYILLNYATFYFLKLASGDDNEKGSERLKVSANGNHERPDNKDIMSSIKVISGLEYLGSGYNTLKAEPYGNEDYYLDSGYQQPIIRFNWQTSMEQQGNMEIIPIGVWMRNEMMCHRSNQVSNYYINSWHCIMTISYFTLMKYSARRSRPWKKCQI